MPIYEYVCDNCGHYLEALQKLSDEPLVFCPECGDATLRKQVSAAAKKPVIVVMMTATPLDLTDVMANDKVGAVMHLGQPSVTVVGVGALLFGKVSPAGRTVQTVYPAAYADEVSIFDFNMRPVRIC